MLSALAQTVILAAEEGEDAGAQLLLPATPELIAGIIAFVIVFLVGWRFAAPAINRALENRQQAIAGQLTEAENAKKEAESLLDDYRGQLADAQAKRNEILEEARASAEQMKAEILDRANAEAAEIVERARVEAAGEKARVLADARQEVANLSIDLAERVVGGSLDRDAQMGLVERYISELEQAR